MVYSSEGQEVVYKHDQNSQVRSLRCSYISPVILYNKATARPMFASMKTFFRDVGMALPKQLKLCAGMTGLSLIPNS